MLRRVQPSSGTTQMLRGREIGDIFDMEKNLCCLLKQSQDRAESDPAKIKFYIKIFLITLKSVS